jgi:hypothetical protein
MNYTRVAAVGRDGGGRVNGVTVEDVHSHQTLALSTKAVINATGCWAEQLHPSPKKPPSSSFAGQPPDFPGPCPARGSGHQHQPSGRRTGRFHCSLGGCRNCGHHRPRPSGQPLARTRITEAEVSYLLEGLHALFPALDISAKDCIATMAGVRPVLSEGNCDPSEESREHVVWVNKGLVTVTGGKLTTFRKLAWDALKAASRFYRLAPSMKRCRYFCHSKTNRLSPSPVSGSQWESLYGRYGTPQETWSKSLAGTLQSFREHEPCGRKFYTLPLMKRFIICPTFSCGGSGGLIDRRGRAYASGPYPASVRSGIALGQPPAGRKKFYNYIETWRIRPRHARPPCRVPGKGEILFFQYGSTPAGILCLKRCEMAEKDLLLSIDNGTQSLKALVFDPGGNLIAKEQVLFTPYFSDRPGWAEQDPKVFWMHCARPARDFLAPMASKNHDRRHFRHHPAGHGDQCGQGWPPAAAGNPLAGPTQMPRPAGDGGTVGAVVQGDRACRHPGIYSIRNRSQLDSPETSRTYLGPNPQVPLAVRISQLPLTGEYVDSVGSQVGYLPFDYKRLRWARSWDWKWRCVPVVRISFRNWSRPGRFSGP